VVRGVGLAEACWPGWKEGGFPISSKGFLSPTTS
jgi:hypothetical protein